MSYRANKSGFAAEAQRKVSATALSLSLGVSYILLVYRRRRRSIQGFNILIDFELSNGDVVVALCAL